MGRIIAAVSLPEAWQDRLLARLHLEEVQRVERERKEAEQRLKRLGQVYLDGLLEQEDYKRQKRHLEERIQALVVPGVDAAQEAGKLLENLPALWAAADLGERRKILLAMLDAVYVDTVEEKAIVAIKPRPAFQALFQLATTKEGSGVALYNEKASEVSGGSKEMSPCFWWRRGRVELPVQKVLWRMCYKLIRRFNLASWSFRRMNLPEASRCFFGYPVSALRQPHPGLLASAPRFREQRGQT